MRIQFKAVYKHIAKDEGGGYVAYAKEFPGAITQGETLEETRENLRDAAALLLEANVALPKQIRKRHKVLKRRR